MLILSLIECMYFFQLIFILTLNGMELPSIYLIDPKSSTKPNSKLQYTRSWNQQPDPYLFKPRSEQNSEVNQALAGTDSNL